MYHLWATFSFFFCLLALSSSQKDCTFRETIAQYVLPELQSLECYNDYEHYVYCYRSPFTDKPLELWNWDHDKKIAVLCEPFGEPVQDRKSFQWRYQTTRFGINTNHTFFFKTKGSPSCLPDPGEPLELSKHLRVRPPMNLSVKAVERGSTLLHWISPYPSSSSLNRNLTYQLSYRREGQENWIVVESQHTQLHLKAESLSACCQYEARVRVRLVGLWSQWSPLVAWQTEAVPGQSPCLQCVLAGEEEVWCSWEVKRDQAQFITYQLACQHNQTALSDSCCSNLTVSVGDTVLRFSCTLTVPDPHHLWLKLIPTHNTQVFPSHRHIQPNRPEHLEVKRKGDNWLVEWNQPKVSERLSLYYQVHYWNSKNPEDSQQLDVKESSLSRTIMSASLVPSQQYQVKVRSVVVTGEGDFSYGGKPSDWSDPVKWDSNPASLSPESLFYVGMTVVVTIAFLILCCTIPECRRRLIKFYTSAPSPRKSKVICDIKVSDDRLSFMADEKTYICKVLQLEKVPISPSEALVWDSKRIDNKELFSFVSDDAGCWDCDGPCSPVEKGTPTETSGISFTGPYIFCQSPLEPSQESVDPHDRSTKEDSLSDGSVSPSSGLFSPPVSSCSQDYVTVPNPRLSSSTLELVSHHNNTGTTNRRNSDNHDNQDSSGLLMSYNTEIQSGLNPSISGGDPLAYIPEPLTPCTPQVVQQPSVYVFLP